VTAQKLFPITPTPTPLKDFYAAGVCLCACVHVRMKYWVGERERECVYIFIRIVSENNNPGCRWRRLREICWKKKVRFFCPAFYYYYYCRPQLSRPSEHHPYTLYTLREKKKSFTLSVANVNNFSLTVVEHAVLYTHGTYAEAHPLNYTYLPPHCGLILF